MAEHPKVFISYSHDSPEHKRWVSELGAKLRHDGVDAILDQWDLGPGDDVTQFMERGIIDSDRVLVVCTDSYVSKANAGEGGVGYERMIVTVQLVRDLGTNKFIPIIRQASSEQKVPTCLGTRFYIDFTDESQFDEKFDELIRELHQVPAIQKPPLGKKPFAQPPSGQEAPPSEGLDTQLRGQARFLHRGVPVPGVELLALFPNKTWKHTTTDENGEAQVNLHSTHLPMTVFAAATGFAAHLEHDWVPAQGALAIEMQSLPEGGAVIFPEGTGDLPGLLGRLNPIRDTHDRTYLYASNITINEGKQQPVRFMPGEDLRLTDADGRELVVRIVAIIDRSALVEYRLIDDSDLFLTIPVAQLPSGQEAPPSEGLDTQLPEIPEQVESASDAYAAAVKLARAGDVLEWRQLVKRIKPSTFRSLVQWRQNELDGQRLERKEQLIWVVDKAVDIISPLISVALVGVESGREQFRDQKSTLDDLLNIAGWNPAGYTPWIDIPRALGHVYHSLHGSLSLSTNQLDLALSLARVKIPVVDGTKYFPVWETGDLVGYSQSIGGNSSKGWKYLIEAYERKWEWLAPIFGEELEYQTSLVAYYMALNIHELATVIALETSLSPTSSFRFKVPLTFLSAEYDITQRAITLLRNQEELTKLWTCLNVTREQMEHSWETWIRLAENQLWSMRVPPIAIHSLSDIYQNFFESL